MTDQQWRLFQLTCKWLERSCEALRRGDKIGQQVAILAHSMTKAAYNETINDQTKQRKD